MPTPEQARINAAKEYFPKLGEAVKKAREKGPAAVQAVRESLREARHSDMYLEHASVLFDAKKERSVVKTENFPILMSTIRTVPEALLTIALLELEKENQNGDITTTAIRKSLMGKMGIESEAEANEVLGETNTIQMHLNGRVGEIIHRRQGEKRNVYYSIADTWKPQVEAYANAVLSFSDKHFPFQLFTPKDKFSAQGESKLPLKVEILQFVHSELAPEGELKTGTVPYTKIKERFPKQQQYLYHYLPDIMENYDRANLLTNERIKNDKPQMEYRLSDEALALEAYKSAKLQDFCRALSTLQAESNDSNQYFSATDAAYRMSEMFPEYDYRTNEKSLHVFLSNFQRMVQPLQTEERQGLLMNKKVSQVRITENNDYQAGADFNYIIANGKERSSHFLTMYRSGKKPQAIKDLWIHGATDTYATYKSTPLETPPQETQPEIIQQEAAALPEDIIPQELPSSAAPKFIRPQEVQNLETKPQAIQQEKKHMESQWIPTHDLIRKYAREFKYEHPYIEEEMAEWKESMQKKEVGGRFFGDEKVLWEFYKRVERRDPSTVLLEDKDVLILNKPPRISAHWDPRHKVGVVEVARLAISSDCTRANRIDNHTSGIMALAKTDAGLEGLIGQFMNKDDSNLEKYYLALVDGRYLREEQFVSVLLTPTQDTRMRIVRGGEKAPPGSKSSETKFKKLAEYYNSQFDDYKTLLQVQPFTGRTHQIRVVAAQFLGLPFTGDYLYNLYSNEGPRTMLHAERLIFTHPTTKKRTAVQAPLPEDFKEYLDQMILII